MRCDSFATDARVASNGRIISKLRRSGSFGVDLSLSDALTNSIPKAKESLFEVFTRATSTYSSQLICAENHRLAMVLSTLRRQAATQTGRLHPLLYLYRANKTWPPDFERLPEKHKFRLERKYRRRSKMRMARPRWTKGVKLAQYGSILAVLTYGIFGLNWDEQDQTFAGVYSKTFKTRELANKISFAIGIKPW